MRTGSNKPGPDAAVRAEGRPVAAASPRTPTIDVHHLLNGRREAVLMLDGEPYRLRITAQNKLILTK